MKSFFAFLIFLCFVGWAGAQITTQPKEPLSKDAFFGSPSLSSPPSEKVQLVHSDFFGVDRNKHEGNPHFTGNVRFSHQGSVLTADEVILYREENFIKAIGHVRLQNADGSVITAEEMEYDGNTERGIARKNVVLTDPRQTIKTQTLYYDRRSNKAYFNSGGTISSDNNVMYTNAATYDISTKIIDFAGNVKIDNPEYMVEGTNIKQNQWTNTAEFFGATMIINKVNPGNYVYTEQGRYEMNRKEVFLNKNSMIHYNGKILTGDKMYYNQLTGFGRAEGHVRLDDPKERRYIIGGYGEIFEKKDSAMLRDRPYAVKIFEKDSLYFSAQKILAYQKADSLGVKKSFLRAFRKGRLYKSNAQARADSISFNETDGILHLDGAPILWSGAKQVTGDRIEAYFDTENEGIDSLRVIGNAFAISKADSLNTKDEFNQVKGRLMTVYYEDNEIKSAQALGNAQAITYAESEDEKTRELQRLGVALSTCGTIEAAFEDRRVQVVSCNIGADVKVYPMSKIAKENRFFKDFNWNEKDRPKVWRDIFLDSPEYEETVYESDNLLYEQAQKKAEEERAKNRPKTLIRVRK